MIQLGSVAKRTLTGVTLSLLVAGLFWLDGQVADGLVPWAMASLLSLLCAWELGRMGGFKVFKLNPLLLITGALVSLLTLLRDEFSSPDSILTLILAAAGLVLVTTTLLGGKSRKLAMFLGLWALVPLHGLITVDALWGAWGMGCLVILSKIGDIFGYFVGRAIGKRHPFKTLSPNKTVAGCVASLLSAVVIGVGLGLGELLPQGPGGSSAGMLAGALIGASINLASQAGDLLESHVKRTAMVKDSSSLAGASGGILDVVDSLLLSVPVALCTWPWLL